jgi:eukaryotic-like serine/threonine-protein kinase
MAIPQKLNARYEIKDVLGQGGMGLVFRAYDTVVKRDVALKTLRDAPTRAAMQMFFKECEVLAALSHPNIVEIFDIGEYEEEGKSKPYFVMPVLPGETLDKLIRASSHRLTVERVVDMISQACRGLHAAHERGLIHRDIKPSNLFIMDDDSVKIIDFGVAHMVESGLTVGAKGTLLYMAPEQLQLKPPSTASDIFSLGVVCYEALTRRRPFQGTKESEIAESILNTNPPPAGDLNPAVSQALSRVVHKALAKQPWNRYANAREFSDTLQKGLRNEPVEFFNPARIQPRIERASKAFEQGDHQFAGEILSELEAEGHIDPAIPALKRQIESASRQKTLGQLLESARTRFEHEEYPLSLQKIQEILLLDPANAPALGMKASIENKMTTQKIDDWYRLARQHIENHSFSHAREAIQNVIEVKPNEPQAAQLLAEVDRLEQEYLKLRKEKEELYHLALDAYNTGEVTSALTKLERVLDLDRRAPESTSTDRATAYQNFYNKVRSEHEVIKNSYAEARKHLADRNFAQALAIANDYLTRYPGHALFQALKFDIEEQQRQELSAAIVEIDRQLDAEPDLDRRVHVLEQAISAHPGETHFERQLRPMREKRDLVNSIAAKARYHEERGQHQEALAQWEILKTIYSQYPGLDFEIERVTKRRDQQMRSEAKGRWVEQIDRAMGAGEYARALDLTGDAENEFPADTELDQLRQLAAKSAQRAGEAQELLARGHALASEQHFDEGFATMAKALDLDPRSPAIRAGYVGALIDRARALMDTDRQAAEPLIQKAIEIDPANLLAKSLRTAVVEHKRDQDVIRCFTQARQMRAAGDFEGALRETEQCLAQYPLDARLAQLRDVLTKDVQEGKRNKARTADLAVLEILEQQAASAHGSEMQTIYERARAIAQPWSADADFQRIMSAIEQRVAATQPLPPTFFPAEAGAAGPPTVAAPPELETLSMFGAPPPPEPPAGTFMPPAEPPAAPAPPGLPQAPAAAQAPPPPQSPPKGGNKPKSAVIWGLAAAGLIVVLLIGVLVVVRSRRAATAPGMMRVEVRSAPPGAVVRVNGKIRGTTNFELETAPGTYQIDASLEGYRPLSKSVTIPAKGATPVDLAFEMLPSIVRLVTDLAEAQVTLDDQPRDIVDGQVVFDSVAAGRHTFKLASKAGEASVVFELAPAALPSIPQPPAAKDVAALVVGTFSSRLRIASTVAPAKVELDGQPIGEVTSGGLDLNVQPGTHELTVSDGRTTLKKVIDVGPAPALAVYLQSDQNIGTLVIVSGEEGADVYIDGRKYRRQVPKGGQLRISREPREYRIRVGKEGFQEVSEQVVQLVKGQEKSVVFQLTPIPTTGHLALQGAPAGAQVFVDQNAAGTVQADGSFQFQNLPPGEHTIELRNGTQRSRPVRRAFVAGQTVQIGGADLALRATTGTLRLSVSPSGASVTLARNGTGPRPVQPGSLDLEEGAYTLTATAAGYAEHSEKVQVSPGQTASVNLVLTREQRKVAAATGSGMEAWETAGSWTQDGEWYSHKGGGTILFRHMTAPGTYTFTVMLAQGGGLLRGKSLQWVINYADDRNYLMFRLDRDNFRRIQNISGRRNEVVRKPHGLDLKDAIGATVQMEVAPMSLSVRVRKGDQWTTLDSLSAPDRDFTTGKFGIVVEGKDEVRLSNFGFRPKE